MADEVNLDTSSTVNAADPTPALRAELLPTAAMVGASFPHGIPESAYLPLLRLLGVGMSLRGVAEVVSWRSARPIAVVYNDALRAAASGPFPNEDSVKRSLDDHGYQEWLAEGD